MVAAPSHNRYHDERQRKQGGSMRMSFSSYRRKSVLQILFGKQGLTRAIRLATSACVLLPALSSPALAADIYKHIAADGSVTYSDDPLDHSNATAAKPLALPASIVVPEPTSASNGNRASTPTKPDLPFRGYQQFSITSPGPEATVRSNNGVVPVDFQLTPSLQAGHSIQAIVDGTSVASWQSTSTNPVLPNIPRGSHQLRLEAFNEEGMVVGRSQTITFHLHQNSAILRPAN